MSNTHQPPPILVLGIDTGGTYTDGVLLDYRSRRVLSTHKSLTTKRDLSIGIEQVIANIQIQDPSLIRMVSVSTTLATNAIAEGKGKRIALFLIGYDQDLVRSYDMEKRFATPHFYYFSGGHDLYGREKEALDLAGMLAKVGQVTPQVDAIAISSYFSPLNPEHEDRAFQAISGLCDLPIVLGHQLSTKLGSVERATTAALNASLLAVLQEFIIAVRRAMERREIEAPLMVVRGDGTLMSAEFAARTPVETIHSGPAASAIGGRFLAEQDEALVVDIGGTTTDLALIHRGQVAISEEGASVGGYKTSVKAAHLLSIGLGGDSHLRLSPDAEITIGPERVVPLSCLASEYESVANRLQTLSKRTWSQASPDWLEYWYLLRQADPVSAAGSDRKKRLLSLLQSGPLPVPEILKKMNLMHAAQLDADELLRQEIIGVSGLTPTDILHYEGRFQPWHTQAAAAAVRVYSRATLHEPQHVIEEVWRLMTEKIAVSIIEFLSGKEVDLDPSASGDFGRWAFLNGLYGINPFLETNFRLRQPLIGIGAPADIFLQVIAEKLHTDFILPANYQVANAVGAVSGSVVIEREILVHPLLSASGLEVLGYYFHASNGRSEFESLDQALEAARCAAQQEALGAADLSGADDPQVLLTQEIDGLDTYRIKARAVGNPRLWK